MEEDLARSESNGHGTVTIDLVSTLPQNGWITDLLESKYQPSRFRSEDYHYRRDCFHVRPHILLLLFVICCKLSSIFIISAGLRPLTLGMMHTLTYFS
ncbi:hypothetical protein ARMGADRAFT_356043 [Armillaria gallica]|uniref:Uncharacterized protein n=1 Tax=Armillaria gallica TaxID=47427 RepID=A0A2H3DBF2_ARMGA|nr:hypothetical protein ARMGADRAFT_356043 [Armillaria gallica]